MIELAVATEQKRQVIDLTDMVNRHLPEADDRDGVCVLNALHTTVALTTADLDPGTDLDMLDAFEELIPKLDYRHPHDPSHTPDHILSAMIGTSLSLPVEERRLKLGTWQRVVLFEFDGPRERRLTIQVLGA